MATTTSTKASPGTKSCLSCPSAMSRTDQLRQLGRDFGDVLCGQKLLMIQRPGVDNSHPVKQASKCDKFGAPLNIKPDAKDAALAISVAMPLIPKPDSNPVGKDATDVTTCNGCRFFVSRDETKKKIGWEAGFCRAKGALLQDDRLWRYAATCDEKQVRRTRDDEVQNHTIVLFPEFTNEYGKVNANVLLRKLKGGTTEDPRTSEPDRPSSEKAMELGIRGWRKVPDQKGKGPDMFLPMFNVDFFEEKYGKEIGKNMVDAIPKTGDPEAPELYLDHDNYAYRVAVLWTRLKETPALWGPAGVGKTELLRHLAWLMSAPFTRISITESTELDDLAGKMMYSPEKGTYFHYGLIPQAWQRENVLCLDEPNTGQPAVWQFIRPMTDNSKQLVLYQNQDERLTANQLMYLGMCMNPSWDPRNTGTSTLADADGSRLMHIAMTIPPPEIEAEIIGQRLKKDRWSDAEIKSVVDVMMAIAPDIRNLSEGGTISTTWGIRHQIKVARYKRYSDWIDAFRMGVVDSLEPGEGEAILDAVRAQVPDGD